MTSIQKQLKESEEKYRNVIEQSQDGVVLVDENAMIIEWNKGQIWAESAGRDKVSTFIIKLPLS